MTDDFVKKLRDKYWAHRPVWEAANRIDKLEKALREIRAMHHEGGVDDLQERDDKTYCIVCDALEGKQ